MARKSGNKTANNNELTEKSSKIGAMYKIAIGICIFTLIGSISVVFAMKRVQVIRCQVGLKQALAILHQAIMLANFESADEKRTDIFYYYLIDAFNTKFESTNCKHSKDLVCRISQYRTMNNKTVMSDMIFKKGTKIVINNILFMVNEPRFPDDKLLITVDVNGTNIPPNRLGYDVFVFQIINNRIRAMGNKGTLYPIGQYDFYCNKKSISKDDLLGVNCTYNAFFDKKYFSNFMMPLF